MTKETLEELRGLLEKCTPLPWTARIAHIVPDNESTVFGFSINGNHPDKDAEGLAGLGVYRHRVAIADYSPEDMKANAALIVTLVNHAAELLDAAAELKELREAMIELDRIHQARCESSGAEWNRLMVEESAAVNRKNTALTKGTKP